MCTILCQVSQFSVFPCLRTLSLQSREQDPVEDNTVGVCGVVCEIEVWILVSRRSSIFCFFGRGQLVLFSGGMPRASYGDRHCLTILQDSNHVTLDFTSRVIDFFTIHSTDSNNGRRDPTKHNRPLE